MTVLQPEFEAQKAIEMLYSADAVAREMGMEIVEGGVGRAVLRMRILPTMVNGHGICHGGLIFTLADTAFAYACSTAGGSHVAVSASIDFLLVARIDDVLRAEAIERWRGGRSGLSDVRVTDGLGQLIALFHGRSRRIDRT